MRDHRVRHVRLNVPHSAQPVPSWQGESVGHYEGDTLVIDRHDRPEGGAAVDDRQVRHALQRGIARGRALSAHRAGKPCGCRRLTGVVETSRVVVLILFSFLSELGKLG